MQQDFEEFTNGYPIVIITRNGQPILAHKSQGFYLFEVYGIAHRIRSTNTQAVCEYVDSTYDTAISLNVAETVVKELITKYPKGVCVVFIAPEMAIHMFKEGDQVVTTLDAADGDLMETTLDITQEPGVIYPSITSLIELRLMSGKLMVARNWLRGLMPQQPFPTFT